MMFKVTGLLQSIIETLTAERIIVCLFDAPGFASSFIINAESMNGRIGWCIDYIG
jgi:hypothetical protein